MDHRRMSAEDYLKSAVTRAEHRVKYCRSELQRFTQCSTDTGGEPEALQARRLRKLEFDLARAEDDLRYAQVALNTHA
jgi:hypothetical protein